MQVGHKEGYLTKRGKNFGGWKTRFFVLQGPMLEYYDCVSLSPLNMIFFTQLGSLLNVNSGEVHTLAQSQLRGHRLPANIGPINTQATMTKRSTGMHSSLSKQRKDREEATPVMCSVRRATKIGIVGLRC